MKSASVTVEFNIEGCFVDLNATTSSVEIRGRTGTACIALNGLSLLHPLLHLVLLRLRDAA